MRILAIDIGTGTQDVLLFDSRLDIENSYKLVLPSPTMMVHRQIRAATADRRPIVLFGRQMGGGPSAWAAAEHARQGLTTYATPQAAVTIDDDLEKVSALGMEVIGDDEVGQLPDEVLRIELRDLDLKAIRTALGSFGVSIDRLDALAAAVFDHGAAPPGVSDRRFRFDYLNERLRARNSLSSFAYLAQDVPPAMSRLRTVAETAAAIDCPLIVMDTAPAAVLGAGFDPRVGQTGRHITLNIGNFHASAFRLADGRIEGLFEHHTGEIHARKLETLLLKLADGSLKDSDVYDDMGHGALMYSKDRLALGVGDFDIVVTGPRRSLLSAPRDTSHRNGSATGLRPYFAVPFGDVMLTGCYGLLAATADLLPAQGAAIRTAMRPGASTGTAPWDID